MRRRDPDPVVAATWPFVARERGYSRSILIVDDQVPQFDRNAGDRCIYDYARWFLGRGWKVALVPNNGLAAEPYTTEFRSIGVEVLTGPVSPTRWLRSNGQYLDVAWISRPEVAAKWIDRIREASSARILYFTQDLHHLREQRRFDATGDHTSLQLRDQWRAMETDVMRRADVVLTLSNAEEPIIASLAPGTPIAVIPLNVTEIAAEPSIVETTIEGRSNLVFIGGFRHPPNTDAVEYLVRDVMPRIWRDKPDAIVDVIGPEPPPEICALAADRVHILGYVPELGPYLRRARMTVSPLRFGAGVKGKIIASLTEGVPVVTTPLGNEGIDLRDGVDALIADTPDAFAAACVRLLADDELWRRLSRAGLTYVSERYSAAAAERSLEPVIGDLLASASAVPAGAPAAEPA